MEQERLGMRELESLIMEILWDANAPLIPSQVHRLLSAHRRLAYTTVTTVLVRLWRKQRVDRFKRGRAFEYRPCVGRDEYAALRMKDILAASGDTSGALARFVDEIAPADLARLKALLRK